MLCEYLQRGLICYCSILIMLSCFADAAETNTSSISVFLKDPEFFKDITTAAVGALLAFLFSFLLSQLTERRKPRKRLLYDVNLDKGLVKIEQNIENKIKILYNNREIENLYHVGCNIKNTGKQLIKNNFIRFEFPIGTEIIEFFFDPKPERELSITEVIDPELGGHERRFNIGHIEHGQQIGFHFILTGDLNKEIKLHSFNEEGDVEFIPGSISRVMDESLKVARFIQLFILFLIIPSIFGLFYFLSPLNTMASGIARLAILISMLPVLTPASKAIGNAIMRLSSDSSKTPVSTIIVDHSPNSIIKMTSPDEEQ